MLKCHLSIFLLPSVLQWYMFIFVRSRDLQLVDTCGLFCVVPFLLHWRSTTKQKYSHIIIFQVYVQNGCNLTFSCKAKYLKTEIEVGAFSALHAKRSTVCFAVIAMVFFASFGKRKNGKGKNERSEIFVSTKS